MILIQKLTTCPTYRSAATPSWYSSPCVYDDLVP